MCVILPTDYIVFCGSLRKKTAIKICSIKGLVVKFIVLDCKIETKLFYVSYTKFVFEALCYILVIKIFVTF
jgi:hypothetical protein